MVNKRFPNPAEAPRIRGREAATGARPNQAAPQLAGTAQLSLYNCSCW